MSCAAIGTWRSKVVDEKKLANKRGRPAGARSKETRADADCAGDPVTLSLQSSSVELLCGIALTVVSEATQSLIPQATELKDKHSTLLTKFGKCHRQFNCSKVFSTEEISILGKYLFQ